jgi:hypothetical protein
MSNYVLPANWESLQPQMLTYYSGNQGFDFEVPNTRAAYELHKTASCAYTQWCINMVNKHPHTEGPIMARRLLGWMTPNPVGPDLNILLPALDIIDDRFFASLDPALARCYSLTLRGISWSPTLQETKPQDVKKVSSEDKKTVKGKTHLSKIKCHSHAKPCSAIKDLATHHRSSVSKGHPVKALHTGTCGVCILYRNCGNKHGRLPPPIYRAVEMAHLGPSSNLSRLCQSIIENRRHPESFDPPLPSETYGSIPRIAIDDDQSSPQVAKLPRIVEERSLQETKLFRVINGVYTFVGTDDDMVTLSRQDLSGTSSHRPKKRVRND